MTVDDDKNKDHHFMPQPSWPNHGQAIGKSTWKLSASSTRAMKVYTMRSPVLVTIDHLRPHLPKLLSAKSWYAKTSTAAVSRKWLIVMLTSRVISATTLPIMQSNAGVNNQPPRFICAAMPNTVVPRTAPVRLAVKPPAESRGSASNSGMGISTCPSTLTVATDMALVVWVPELETDADLTLPSTTEPPGEQKFLAASASSWSKASDAVIFEDCYCKRSRVKG
mmetsp:Transcript_46907/g.118955  ORF Transcript_46907/g.118955 Transcript_46907/m.118955 type:complete len:223 (-) Transcript_46907:32-700(-)